MLSSHQRPGAVNERRESARGGVRRSFRRLILRQHVETGVLFRSCLMISDAETKSWLTRGPMQRRPVGGGVGVRGDRALSCHGLCVRLPVQVGAEECQLRRPRIQL